MVDEIELVSQFRSDVPEPSRQARAQAWAAVMTVVAEEGADGGRKPCRSLPFGGGGAGARAVRWWRWSRPSSSLLRC